MKVFSKNFSTNDEPRVIPADIGTIFNPKAVTDKIGDVEVKNNKVF